MKKGNPKSSEVPFICLRGKQVKYNRKSKQKNFAKYGGRIPPFFKALE